MENLKETKNKLIQEYGNRCSICGREFTENNVPVIDCIIPRSKGGTLDLYNLQLTCRSCNNIKSNRFILGEVFETYIQKLIQKSRKYEVIKEPNFQHRGVDLIIKDNGNYKLCEIKISTTFTTSRIDNIIRSLKNNEEIYSKVYKNVTSILIFPGEISEKNMETLKNNHIEVWDRAYIKENFKKEILEIDNPYFNKLFCLFDTQLEDSCVNKYDNEIDKKIEELKNCESGIKNWGNYQKLIGEILELLFYPSLERTIVEKYDFLKSNRRDFIMPNYAKEGFWSFARENYKADFIVIDAKNSSKGVNKQDILQVANYLKGYGMGLFGIIIGRKYNENRIKATLIEQWAIQNKMIVVLNDNDIEQMLIEKKNNGQPELIVRQKIEDFRISI